MRIKHFGEVKDGRLELSNRDAFKAEIAKFNGKRVYLVVDEEKPQRSTNQNSYYWGIVLKMLADYLGYTVDEIHELMKYKFLPKREVYGQEVVGSTQNLKTNEFEDYLSRIRSWGQSKLNLTIPLPNEVDHEC